jgi:hypothetical protein
VHIMCIYNSKNPRTWDEISPYVQHNYNISMHRSIDHNPFQVGLGFQPLGPMDVAVPLETTQVDSSHAQTIISPMPSTSSTMINTGCHTSFRWEIKFGCTCRKNALQDPIRSFIHIFMDLIPSPIMWVKIFLSSTFPPSLSFTHCLMWTSFDHTFHHYWTPPR